jgi:hypothetical protein
MVRKIAVLVAGIVVGLSAVAAAAPDPTYSGKSTLHVDGVTATHPFSLKVKHGKVTSVSLLAGSNCTDIVLESGKAVSFKIKHGSFKGSIHVAGGSTIKLSGKFSGHHVSGAFSGTARAGTASCSIPKNTYSATKAG